MTGPYRLDDNGDESTRKFSLYHYNLAINQLLRSSGRTTDGVTDTVVTLLVCYLFTCFDNLAGNHSQAFRHLRSGITLLNETWTAMKNARNAPHPSSGQELIRQVTEQFRHLDMHAATFLLEWAPQVLPEDGMDEARESRCEVGPIDIRLYSLNQAADRLESLIPKVMGLRRWESQFVSDSKQGITESSPVYMATLRKFLNWQIQMIGQLEEWSTGFTMLLKKGSDQMCISDRRLVQMMQLHYIVVSTFLFMSAAESEMAYDGVLSQFKTAVSLASALASNPATVCEGQLQDISNTEPSFTLEMGIVPALYLVGIKCRDPLTRREIISILRKNPRREGVWDSVSAAKILERVMEIEEGDDRLGFELGLKGMADIPLDRRMSRIHWGPNNGLFGPAGSRMAVGYELCSSVGGRRFISENIIL